MIKEIQREMKKFAVIPQSIYAWSMVLMIIIFAVNSYFDFSYSGDKSFLILFAVFLLEWGIMFAYKRTSTIKSDTYD